MEAYVTLATTDGYGVGALVLGHSLLSQGTTKQLCVLVTPEVSDTVKVALSQVYHSVVVVDVLDSHDSAHLALLDRPELGVTFTKLHCWTLIQYTKCVFLDADILAMQNTDELFSQPEMSAACDVGWPDCFNSGMFVFTPSKETYSKLLAFARTTGSFDGGDQGLLNSFFPNWNRLSFLYNMVASATYTYLPAFKQFGRGVKFVHFLGATKPWHGESSSSGQPGAATYEAFVQAWWTIYRQLVQPNLPSNEAAAPSSPHQQQQEPVAFQHPEEYKNNNVEQYQTTDHHRQHEEASSSVEVMTYLEEFDEKSNTRSFQTQTGTFDTNLSQNTQPLEMSATSQIKQSTDSMGRECSPFETVDRPSYSATGQPAVIYQSEPSVVEVQRQAVDTPALDSRPLSPKPQNLASSTATVVQPKSPIKHRSSSLPPSEVPSPSTSPTPPVASSDVAAAVSGPITASVQLEQTTSCRDVSELAQQLSTVSLQPKAPDNSADRQRWEAGRPDYMGKDSFDNILAYINTKVKK